MYFNLLTRVSDDLGGLNEHETTGLIHAVQVCGHCMLRWVVALGAGDLVKDVRPS